MEGCGVLKPKRRKIMGNLFFGGSGAGNRLRVNVKDLKNGRITSITVPRPHEVSNRGESEKDTKDLSGVVSQVSTISLIPHSTPWSSCWDAYRTQKEDK